MPARLKKTPKVSADDTAASREIFIRYFVSLGLACETLPYHSPAWHAAFRVKFGKSEYRLQAWAQVRESMHGLLPAQVFHRLDEYFSTGGGLHFTHAFAHQDLLKMQAAIQHHTAPRPALLNLPKRVERHRPPLKKRATAILGSQNTRSKAPRRE